MLRPVSGDFECESARVGRPSYVLLLCLFLSERRAGIFCTWAFAYCSLPASMRGGSQPVRETVTYVTPRPLPPPVGIEFLRTLQYVFSRPLLRINVTDTRHDTNSNAFGDLWQHHNNINQWTTFNN